MNSRKSYNMSTITHQLQDDFGHDNDNFDGGTDNFDEGGTDSCVQENENKSAKYTNRFHLGKYRHLISFWLFGLCNNFAYVVMLSAAHDILHVEQGNGTDSGDDNGTSSKNQSSNETSDSEYLICNHISTGAILLADILPTLVVKLTFPFFLQKIPYLIKVSLIAFFGAASFVIVALAQEVWLSIIGVVCASIGAGIGEITFLSMTTFYHRDVVSSWSSGTGGAGIFGALVYAGFTSAGISPRNSLLIMLVVPALLMIVYLFLLPPIPYDLNVDEDDKEQGHQIMKETDTLTLKEKFQLIPPLFKYMLPLSLVYFAEYFINQGLHELLYYNGEFLSKKEQYRWFQVDYQIGVFISRSSVNLFHIKKLWILPVLQFANMALLMFQVYYRFIPSFWIIMAIVLWEGLLGGASYVNTFYRMTNELSSHVKEFCIGIATLGDSIGIAIAGSAAIPFHNHICDLKIKM